MAHIYIALVDTPGFFASLIRHYLGQKYVHVVLSLDEQLSEAYSFGRRNPYIPLIAGFERFRRLSTGSVNWTAPVNRKKRSVNACIRITKTDSICTMRLLDCWPCSATGNFT